MRSRDEVLREFNVSTTSYAWEENSDGYASVIEAMSDRIRELEAASGEPLLWAIYDKDGDLVSLFNRHDHALRACWFNSDSIVPLYAAPPSAAGVTVTEAMVEAAAKALRDGFRSVHANNEGHNVWRGLASISIHAALTNMKNI